MSLRDKLYFNVISFSYLILKKRWKLSEDNFYKKNFIKPNKVFIENEEIEPSVEGKIVIFKKDKIEKGWYFLGIYHFGDNKNSLLKIRTSTFGNQCRPAFPSRRRWRVIRIRNKCHLSLELSQIKNPVKIREIWLLKIPRFFAWFKIKKRVEISYSKIYLKSLNKKNKWRKYNSILSKQFGKHQQFSYKDWIKFSEKPIYSSILKKIDSTYIDYEKNFIILDRITKVTNKNLKWVVILRKNIILSNKFEAILKWIDTKQTSLDIFYGDEDHLTKNNFRYNPIFKSAWNRELFWSDPLYSAHWIISSKLWNLICEDIQDLKIFNFEKVIFSIIERLILEKKEISIKHIPFIISHRLNNFYDYYNKEKMINNSENLKVHLKRISPNKFICVNEDSTKKIKFIEWVTPKDNLLSIIIPTRDKVHLLKNCIDSIHKYSNSSNMEILIVNNNSIEKDTFLYFDQLKNKYIKNISYRILNFNNQFNYSKINNYAVEESNGDTLILLNNDIEFLSENWDIYLSSNANREDIGCVGAKLIFDDFTIQHSGVVLGIGGVAGHSHKYFSSDSLGYYGRLNMAQEYSAVTAACLCITKSKWLKIGGLDEVNLAVNYNDVDFCLKSRECNFRNIYLPHVLAIHHESKTRGKPIGKTYNQWRKEYKFMQKKWGQKLKKDNFYNPHLSLEEEDWSISINEYNLELR